MQFELYTVALLAAAAFCLGSWFQCWLRGPHVDFDQLVKDAKIDAALKMLETRCDILEGCDTQRADHIRGLGETMAKAVGMLSKRISKFEPKE